MKTRIATAVALGFALTQLAAMPAYAEQSAQAAQTQFRTAAPQQFSAQDLQQYGLDKSATQRAMDLQKDGYQIRVLSGEEAQKYQAGITDNQWLLLGILAGVIVIAVAVAD
jgi:Flp pilus assembly protein TadB